ncbi:DUF7096 domain-containing protein [Natronobeatus ordinarius]|uniref:DUF7096 domain-containing protein n=1 Tax=Natronobeatus ordinarius TaxID=2963433 RepID=UPI0020CE0B80|nr:hypothetical protein [Natronobeatus ordinarius]
MKNAVSAALLALLLVCSLPAIALATVDPAGDETLPAADIDHGEPTAVDWLGYESRSTSEPGVLRELTPVTVDDASMRGVVEADATTNRLVLEGDVRSSYVETSPNLGATLAAQDDAVRIDNERFVVDRAITDGSTVERQEAIEAAYDRIQTRVDALESREHEAVSAHVSGQLSDEALLTVLRRNYEEANALDEALEQLEAGADQTIGISIDTKPDQMFLEQYRGPVRSQFEVGGSGPQTTADVRLETSADGVSLAMIAGDEYVTETIRFDNRELDRSPEVESLSAAEEYAELYYPWTVNEQPVGVRMGLNTISDYSPVRLHWVEMRTVQGDLEVSLDTGSTGVYREVQSLSIESVPSTSQEETWTNDTLELSINRTAVDGPMEVVVTDQETGDPADVTVVVDGRELGQTGEDGTLWILPPVGEFELSAQTPDETVNATVSGWASTI